MMVFRLLVGLFFVSVVACVTDSNRAGDDAMRHFRVEPRDFTNPATWGPVAEEVCTDSIERLARFDFRWTAPPTAPPTDDPQSGDGAPHEPRFSRFEWNFDWDFVVVEMAAGLAERTGLEVPNVWFGARAGVFDSSHYLYSATVRGDNVEFQNGFGAWRRYTYDCSIQFGPDEPFLLSVSADPGRLPPP